MRKKNFKDHNHNFPNFRTALNSKDIKGGYNNLLSRNSGFCVYLALFCIGLPFFLSFFSSVKRLLVLFYALQKEYNNALFLLYIFLVTLFVCFILFTRAPNIYLIDFSLYHGDDFMKLSRERFKEVMKLVGTSQECFEFQCKIIDNSDIGDETMFPAKIMEDYPLHIHEQNLLNAKYEAQTVIFSCVKDVLVKTGIKAKQIDILVVNCSLFCPTPSLSAMVVNHFKMKESIKAFNLGGMGCSAGVISIDLAKDLLKTTPSRYALVVSTENITLNYYKGKRKSMLIPNTLFRVGGVAIILSNMKETNAKLRLMHTIRTHKGRDNDCFDSVVQEEDEEGTVGVRLNKNVMEVAGKALKANITILAPLTLPFSEQIKYFLNLSSRLLLNHDLSLYFPKVICNILYFFGDRFLTVPTEKKVSI